MDATGPAACCIDACAAGTALCSSSTALQTCVLQSVGCTAYSNSTCSAGQACASYTTPLCVVDPWAEWPMPNSQADVTAGAPNLASFTDNKDGTVTDNVTGLMWQQVVPTTKYTWSDAVAYCPMQTLAGHNDWRLPSRIQLASIVDAGQANPAINTAYFPSTLTDVFWSSTPVAVAPSWAWYVNFTDGIAGNGEAANLDRVRCVRGGAVAPTAPPDRYVTDDTSGTVYDSKTKLTWKQTVPSTKYAWADAKTLCAGLGTGWRLPTIKELQTIVDGSRFAPSIYQGAFLSAAGDNHWSSTPSVPVPSSAWAVDFGVGFAAYSDASSAYHVRCVH